MDSFRAFQEAFFWLMRVDITRAGNLQQRLSNINRASFEVPGFKSLDSFIPCNTQHAALAIRSNTQGRQSKTTLLVQITSRSAPSIRIWILVPDLTVSLKTTPRPFRQGLFFSRQTAGTQSIGQGLCRHSQSAGEAIWQRQEARTSMLKECGVGGRNTPLYAVWDSEMTWTNTQWSPAPASEH